MALIIPGIVFFTSCVEQPLEDDNRLVGPSAESIENLKISEFFEWKTTSEITVNIEGLPMDVGVNRKLALITESGEEIFAGSHKMDEDFEMAFDLPQDINTITMKYGQIEKTAEIIGKEVSFDFLNAEAADDVEP